MQSSVLSSGWATIPWFPCAVRELRGSAGSRVRVLYKGRRQLPKKRLGNVQEISLFVHMKTQASTFTDDYDEPLITIQEDEEAHEDDLWFLRRLLEEEPDDLPPGPRAEPPDWQEWLDAWELWMTGCCVARKAGGIASLLLRQRTSAGSQGIG